MEIIYEENKDWHIGISVSNDGFQQISFVNGVNTWVGGSHIDFILNQIIPDLRERIKKKYKTDVSPTQIKQHMFLFLNTTVKNPKFSSQTKERLISDKSDFINPIKLSQKFLNSIYKSEVTEKIVDWLNQKKLADERAAERNVNKTLSKVRVEKLIDCKLAGTTKSNITSLSITEGDSAATGFRKFRDPQTQALLPIRGKILNVRDSTKDKVLANVEIKSIMAAVGLEFGKSPFVYGSDGKIFKDNTRIHEIRIYSDADTDGSHIAGLIVNLIAFYWPDMIKEHRVLRVDTPIIIAKQGKNAETFYYMSDFEEWCKTNDESKWNIEYYKGLGALEDDDYKEIVQNPKMYYFGFDEKSNESLDIWFGNDSEKRKLKLLS